MKKDTALVAIVLAGAAFIALIGVGFMAFTRHVEPKEASQILAVLHEQMDALNRKDLPAYMATLHPEAPGAEKTRDLMQNLFQQYALRYTLSDASVETVENDLATLKFTQVTERISGGEFRDNRIKGVHTLKKWNGAWKFFNTKIIDIQYLNDARPEASQSSGAAQNENAH